VKWPVIQNKKMQIRILLKGEFAEVYIDGKLVQCYGFNKPVIHNIGVFAEMCLIEVESLKAYAFT
jgi:hypothetical protein